MLEKRYYLKSKNDILGKIVISGENFEDFDGYIKLYDNIDSSKGNLLWFPDYENGTRYFDREYLKFFIESRSSDPERPQLEQKMAEIGMEKYDRLQLFLYAKGKKPTDWLYIEEIQ